MKLRSTRQGDYLYIDWWLMNHCNYNCSYCPDLLKNSSADLPNIDHCKEFVTEVKDFAKISKRICKYYLTGGEVTVWPWLVNLLEFIKKTNGKTSIRTNASMPIQEWERLCDSLDSANIEVHSEHTQISHFMMCLHTAKKKNVNVGITMNMLPDRWQELEDVITKIQKIWPEQSVHRKLLFEDPARNTKPLSYNAEQTVKLKRQSGDLILENNGEEEFTDFQTLVLEGKNKFKGSKCMAGIEQLIVDAWGRVYRGHCRQSGLIGVLGKGYVWSNDPIECRADACVNGFDILATKF